MAPVAGRVADREKDGLVLLLGLREGLDTPGIPVDRIVLMLFEVGTEFLGEAVFLHETTSNEQGNYPEMLSSKS